MKRIIAAILMLSLLLAGCREAEPATEPAQEDLIVVGISQVGAESDWRVANSESMKAVFTEENGYRLLFEDARQQQENQIMAVRKFIQQNVDYIILMPISESGWDSVLQEARDAGIPLILVDRMVSVEDDSLYTTHVGSNTLLQGQKATAWMEKTYAGREEAIEIIHIQGTIDSTAQLGRTRALEAAAERNANWQILVQMDGDFTQAKAYEVMTAYLDQLPQEQDIDVVYCENDNEAFGAIEALEEHGYVCGADVDVICFDATRRGLELCLEGKIALVAECNPLLGPMAEEIVAMLEAGCTPQKNYFVEEQCFTAENLTQSLIDSRAY
nr:ABC transporter substrate-binding protein [Oscillospiraceae bacterium]